ncbi:MAG TPA: hypothetical protein EYP14_19155, partial [Planctomycetaceae bacterium]|nr:hypothetical protein [Planctomycetaceae bacterium]
MTTDRICNKSALLGIASAWVIGSGLASVQAQGWGTVTGQFVLDGPVPAPRVLIHQGDRKIKDAEVCAAHDVPAEDLIVDPTTKGIKNMFVYLRRAPKAIHPDLKRSRVKELVQDQVGCRYVPHALIVRTDQVVVVKSDDPIAHNTHTYPIFNQPLNVVLKPKDRTGIKVTFRAPEIQPIAVKCDLHPWMLAYWLVVNHPYAALTDEQGRFTIEKLPAGRHTLTVWHERVGYVNRRLKVTVRDGETTDLGTLKVPL